MSVIDEISAHEPETIFGAFETGFPILREGDKINTLQFLEGCKGVVSVIEKLGKMFAPVKYDLQGNIKKLTKKYNQNPSNYLYLEDMILEEKKSGANTATDALMWLRRGLQFLLILFEGICADYEEGIVKDHLSTYLRSSYEATLERYHGWLGGQLFNVLCRYTSTTKAFFTTLALGKEDKEDVVLRDMRIFNGQLSKCVNQLIEFYDYHDLETNYVV